MQLLSGLAEVFLSYDTSVTTGHIGGVAVFDDDGRSATDRLEFVRRRITERLPTIPPLRWQLVQYGFDRFWAETEVDVEEHVRPASVESPGNDVQFYALLDNLMSPRLNRLAPMWHISVIDGLENGRYAYLFKIAYGLVDGTTMMSILDLLSDDPVETPVETPMRAETVEEILAEGMKNANAVPARLAQIQADLASWMGERIQEEGLGALPGAMARMIPGEMGGPLVSVVNAYRAPGVPEIAPYQPTTFAPNSPFNGTVTPRVGMALLEFPLEDLRKIGKLVGGSINDALLAACAGGLRQYMAKYGGLSRRPLLASNPIPWRSTEETESERWTNQMWMVYLHLPTDVADPMERLRAAHQASTTARDNWARLPRQLIRDTSALAPGALFDPMSELLSQVPAGLLPKAYNVRITNVIGPRVRPTYNGAEMQKFFVYGFLPPTCGLLASAVSLVDQMTLTYTGCWDIVRHIPALGEFTRESFEELLART